MITRFLQSTPRSDKTEDQMCYHNIAFHSHYFRSVTLYWFTSCHSNCLMPLLQHLTPFTSCSLKISPHFTSKKEIWRFGCTWNRRLKTIICVCRIASLNDTKIKSDKKVFKMWNKVVWIHIKRRFIFIICHKRRNIYGSFDASIYCLQRFIGFSLGDLWVLGGSVYLSLIWFLMGLVQLMSVASAASCCAVPTILHKASRWHERCMQRIINALQRNILPFFGLCVMVHCFHLFSFSCCRLVVARWVRFFLSFDFVLHLLFDFIWL